MAAVIDALLELAVVTARRFPQSTDWNGAHVVRNLSEDPEEGHRGTTRRTYVLPGSKLVMTKRARLFSSTSSSSCVRNLPVKNSTRTLEAFFGGANETVAVSRLVESTRSDSDAQTPSSAAALISIHIRSAEASSFGVKKVPRTVATSGRSSSRSLTRRRRGEVLAVELRLETLETYDEQRRPPIRYVIRTASMKHLGAVCVCVLLF